MSPAGFTASVALVIALGAGGVVSAQRSGDTLPASVGDLNAAQLVEVRDLEGQVLLHGTLKTSSNSGKETERKAELVSPTGQKTKGRVEIEIERKDGVAVKDQIELSLERLPAMTQCELFIDGRHATSFMTSKAGRAELKLDRRLTSLQ